MATRRYSLNPGDGIDNVTEAVGAAVATKSVELTVDLAGVDLSKAKGRETVLKALEIFEAWITRGKWPPA